MTTAEKLKIIQKLSALSQEKLAQKLGVSFATLNSWINQRTEPRKKARLQIEELYLEYTGQKVIPPEILQEKKQVLQDKCLRFPDALKTILDAPDIYDQFVLSLTYHTNRIEGSTLTEPETAAILFNNTVLPNKNLIEHLEVKNHQAALRYLLGYMATAPRALDESFLLGLHQRLMNGIRGDAGNYRSHGVRIVGADVPTANYVKVPHLMKELVESINKSQDDTILHIAEIHSRFEQIHPFSDGNGRTGRLLIHAMAFGKNLPPAVIKQEKKQLYYTYLNKAQQTMHEDVSLLEDFLCDAFIEGYRLMER